MEQITLRKAIGKKVQKVLSDEEGKQVVLIFSDDSYVSFGIRRAWEHCDDRIDCYDLGDISHLKEVK